ncbi:MAG: hypothetical protein M1838_004552 [Thelocarpon superellum]|nr:MAG: hypothetical protein M1838_004552 [Thelocarpon superellum]
MEGADSFVTYVPQEAKDAQKTKRSVEEHGGTCHLHDANLKPAATCKRVVEAALEKMDGINILVINDASRMMKKIIASYPKQWEHFVRTNIHPFFYPSTYCLPHMTSGNSIINCASISAYVGRPNLRDYTSTKGAIVSFARGLSNQVVGKGIRVNAVCPGPVWTPLVAASMDEDAYESFQAMPMGRPGQASELVACFVFWASQDIRLISRWSLHHNGGEVVNP